MDEERLHAAALRLLQVFTEARDRPRHGLMPHEFAHAFKTDGWQLPDVKAAADFAYAAGWIETRSQYYCLTEGGKIVVAAMSD